MNFWTDKSSCHKIKTDYTGAAAKEKTEFAAALSCVQENMIQGEIMKKIPVLNSMQKTRDTRFLKNYTLNYTNSEGGEKIYETVSNFDYDCPEQLGQRASGVVIVGFAGEKILLCREFRMGVNHFVYNLPAGHIDEGENVEECARRELFEETGLALKRVRQVLSPSYASPDLSDSSAWVLFAEVEGELPGGASEHTEADEWIQPGFYSREETAELLKKERFSGRAQMAAYFFAEGFQMKKGEQKENGYGKDTNL